MKSSLLPSAVVAHSGGPTSVINASLPGLAKTLQQSGKVAHLYGALHGIEGLQAGNYIDLFTLPEEKLECLGRAPSSALGTSRRRADQEALDQIVLQFRKHNVRSLFYTGGNGSMGTAAEIEATASQQGWEMQVLGIPKTIDNDLVETDHSPGYGSAARMTACMVRDIGEDNRALPGQVEFIEVLGRNTGWIAAASVLARQEPEDAPHLVYLPENRMALQNLFEDVRRVFKENNRCVVVVCEGQLDEAGQPFGADTRPGSGGALAMNLGHRLALLTTQHLGLRARSEKPGLLARSSALQVSPVDSEESRLCGRAAAQAALSGQTGCMVTLQRMPGRYHVETGLASFDKVARKERLFPNQWITQGQNDIRPEFLDYVRPLTGEIAMHERLR